MKSANQCSFQQAIIPCPIKTCLLQTNWLSINKPDRCIAHNIFVNSVLVINLDSKARLFDSPLHHLLPM